MAIPLSPHIHERLVGSYNIVFHLFPFKPISTIRRIASEREVSLPFAHASIVATAAPAGNFPDDPVWQRHCEKMARRRRDGEFEEAPGWQRPGFLISPGVSPQGNFANRPGENYR